MRAVPHAVIIRVFCCVFSVVNNSLSGIELFYGDSLATALLKGVEVAPYPLEPSLCRIKPCAGLEVVG